MSSVFGPLADDDFEYAVARKGVEIGMGLDIASGPAARPSRVIGKVRPSALAVLRLRSNYFVDCRTGRWPGLAPLKMRFRRGRTRSRLREKEEPRPGWSSSRPVPCGLRAGGAAVVKYDWRVIHRAGGLENRPFAPVGGHFERPPRPHGRALRGSTVQPTRECYRTVTDRGLK